MLEWDDRNYKLVFNVSNLWSTELVTIQLKILFQEICKLYVGWDDVVNKIPPKWKSVCEFLNSLLVIIDRCYYVYNVVFCEIGAFKNLAKFTGKHLWQSLFFNKVAGQRLWYTCFPVNFAKFPRTHFVTEHLRSLLLSYFGPLSLNFVSLNMDLKRNVRIIQTTKLESLKFYLLTNVLQCAKLLMY